MRAADGSRVTAVGHGGSDKERGRVVRLPQSAVSSSQGINAFPIIVLRRQRTHDTASARLSFRATAKLLRHSMHVFARLQSQRDYVYAYEEAKA